MNFNSNFDSTKTANLEILLTNAEAKSLQKLLPQFYSLSVTNRKAKQVRPKRPVPFATPDDPQKNRPKRKAYTEAERTIRGTSDAFRLCSRVLNVIKRKQNAEPFLDPVDPIALGVPTYFDVIKNPMDLSTVDRKLKEHRYTSPEEFEADMRLIWKNAMTFNPIGTHVYVMAETIQGEFEQVLKREKEGMNGRAEQKRARLMDIDEEERAPKRPQSRGMMERPMSYNEKKNLSNMIRMLPTDHLWGVWNIVSGGDTSKANGELEFDIETLPVRIARELEKFVKQKIATLNKKKKSGVKKIPETVTTVPKEKTNGHVREVYREDVQPPVIPAQVVEVNPVESKPVEQKVQANFVIENDLNKRDPSESSLISGLDDSDC